MRLDEQHEVHLDGRARVERMLWSTTSASGSIDSCGHPLWPCFGFGVTVIPVEFDADPIGTVQVRACRMWTCRPGALDNDEVAELAFLRGVIGGYRPTIACNLSDRAVWLAEGPLVEGVR